MVRRRRGEFPGLAPLGLTTVAILGDGNCLFNALSDQIYGHQKKHGEIRDGVIKYLRNNRSEFIHFIAVDGTRRNPKRKNSTAPASSLSFQAATEEEKNIAYEAHLKSMSQGGTYGDNLEIIAFAKAFDTDVKIFTSFGAYYVRAVDDDGAERRRVAYIARHVWEHYSSVRNTDGPFSGLPEVHEKQEGLGQTYRSTSPPSSPGSSISGPGSPPSSPDSLPSSPGSFSIQRDTDSDSEEEIQGPSKRQNRKIKAMKKATTTVTSVLPALTTLPPLTPLPKLSADPRVEPVVEITTLYI